MKIEEMFIRADQYEEEAIRIRRDFHKYPEAAWTEFRTTSKIITFLKERGIEVHYGLEIVNPEYAWSYPELEEVRRQEERAICQGADPDLVKAMNGYTGAVAVIDSGKQGPVLAFRFDIDCNNVDETQNEDHRPNREGFASVNEHCMHACGHDGHATMGMILAAILQEQKEEFTGKVKIIFQPSEEGDKGARSLVERGVLDDVETICGMHIVNTDREYPALAGSWRGMYATSKFDVRFTGKSAHAGLSPEKGNNAVLAAAAAILAMQGFTQDGMGTTRLNVGVIYGGTGRNVVPEFCALEMETRGSDAAVEKRLYESVCNCVRMAAATYGCEADIILKGYCPPGNGDSDFAEEIVKAVKIVKDLKWTKTFEDNTGGTDDFAYMMQHLQKQGKRACYMVLFTRLAAGLHNGCYDMDECCLKAGVKSCLAVLKDLQEKGEDQE